jgi:hypothetical protein
MAGVVLLIAQLLGRFEAGVRLVLEEAEKVLPLDKVDLAGAKLLKQPARKARLRAAFGQCSH